MHQLKTGGDNKSLGFWQALAGPNQLLNLQPVVAPEVVLGSNTEMTRQYKRQDQNEWNHPNQKQFFVHR